MPPCWQLQELGGNFGDTNTEAKLLLLNITSMRVRGKRRYQGRERERVKQRGWSWGSLTRLARPWGSPALPALAPPNPCWVFCHPWNRHRGPAAPAPAPAPCSGTSAAAVEKLSAGTLLPCTRCSGLIQVSSTAKVKVPCAKSLLCPIQAPLRPEEHAGGLEVAPFLCCHGTGWQCQLRAGDPAGFGRSAQEQQLRVEAAVDGNGRIVPQRSPQGPSGGCSPWVAELLLRREPPRTRPRLRCRSALPLLVSPWLRERCSCWQRPPRSLPVPRRPGCLRKVKLNVWKEQISDETRPFMLSRLKIRAEC